MTHRVFTMLPASFEDLPFAEKLVLWGMRAWLRAYREDRNPHVFLRHGFKLAGVSAAWPALDGVMTVITGAGDRVPGIRSPRYPEVSVGEQRLLATIAAIQQGGDRDAVNRYLACWLPETAIRIIYGSITDLAMVMGGAGLFVRPRHAGDIPDTEASPETAIGWSDRTVH